MPIPPLKTILPYPSNGPLDKSPTHDRIYVFVDQSDRRVVNSATGDDFMITFLVQHAFQRTANFIRKHGIVAYDPTNHARLIEFIRNGTDSEATGHSPTQHDAGPTSSVRHTVPSASSVAPGSHESNPRGGRVSSKAGTKDKGSGRRTK